MAKLVVLSTGMAGRTCELNVDKTTIGRVEDNTFQIAEPSVSSHHCEVFLRGTDVVVKDLNSTNGTFINNEKIAESVLKPGQTLRLGQIEIRLDSDGTSAAPAPSGASASTAPAPTPTSPRKPQDTMVMQRGVTLNELEQGPRTGGFDTSSKAFSKKSNQANKLFLIGGIVIGFVILAVLAYIFYSLRQR